MTRKKQAAALLIAAIDYLNDSSEETDKSDNQVQLIVKKRRKVSQQIYWNFQKDIKNWTDWKFMKNLRLAKRIFKFLLNEI